MQYSKKMGYCSDRLFLFLAPCMLLLESLSHWRRIHNQHKKRLFCFLSLHHLVFWPLGTKFLVYRIQVSEVQAIFISSLQELYERHKVDAGYKGTALYVYWIERGTLSEPFQVLIIQYKLLGRPLEPFFLRAFRMPTKIKGSQSLSVNMTLNWTFVNKINEDVYMKAIPCNKYSELFQQWTPPRGKGWSEALLGFHRASIPATQAWKWGVNAWR